MTGAASYRVRHVTTIRYASPVRLARFNVRLRPAAWPGQTIGGYHLAVDPAPSSRGEHEGAYVSRDTRLVLRAPIDQLTIESTFSVMVDAPAIDYASVTTPSLAEVRAAALAQTGLSALAPASYLFASPIAQPSDEIAAWSAPLCDEGGSVVAVGQALMHSIYVGFRYEPGATHSDTPPLEAFRARHGVCQDFAHVMIIAARSQGIPAAYVSGYLRTYPPPGRSRLVGADAMHAWAVLWCGEELGWIGFDPTNDRLAGTDHIVIAMGRDYGDVSPLDGVFHGGSRQTMDYSVDVAPLEQASGA
jgi:transglutaminase-like putative cysteine protease